MDELDDIDGEYCVYSGYCPDIADSAVYILADTATIYTLVWLEEVELERETTHSLGETHEYVARGSKHR